MGRNISIHKGRKSLSAKQVSGGFAFFIVSLLLSGISFSFPSGTNTAQASRSGKQLTELEGTIIVQHEDGPDWSRTVYFLDTGGEQVRLKFRDESVALRAGARVSVRGKLRHGVLKVKNAAADLRVTEGLLALASRPVGEQRALVMLFNFQDNPGHKPWAADAIRNLFFNTVNQFYKEASYNATWISGDFTGWYTLPIASTDCAADKRAAAEAGARALGFEPNNYARKVYIYPRQGCNSWAGLTINYLNSAGFKSEIWINGYADFKTLAHEYGHSLGFAHSASYTCNGGVLAGTCTRSEYGDRYDVMGNTSTGYVNAAHRDDAGWFTAGMPMIEQVTEDGVYTIGPLEAMDGNLKALKIFKSIDPATGLANYYYLEFRQAIGYDSYLSSYPAITGGVLFHLALAPKDTSLFYDCKLLDMTPGTSGADQALGVGRSYTDPDIPVTISVLSANSAGATVSVQFGVPECARSNPAVVMNPVSAGPVAAGMPVNYTVTVSNHDSSACAASSFNLLATAPAGWTATFANPALTLSPGASGSTTLQLISLSSATLGNYAIQVTAANGATPGYQATTSATYAVGSLSTLLATDRLSYTRNQSVAITAVVTSGGSPAAGASVSFATTKPNGAVVRQSATTGADGRATVKLRLKQQDPAGTYRTDAVVSKNGMSASAVTSFVVR